MGLKELSKIEAYDISHLYQNNAVASCIVFTKDGPNKSKYRIFNIPNSLAGNDTGSLEHALSRRLKYFKEKNTKPDLILIDGGKSQLKFAVML